MRLLNVVIANYPDSLTRVELAEQAGVSVLSSGFEKQVSRLSALGLTEYPEPGSVVATELLFPEAIR